MGKTNFTQIRSAKGLLAGLFFAAFLLVGTSAYGQESCNDQVNVQLDENCVAPLPYDAVLENPQGSDYVVKVAYPNEGHSYDEVTKCGVFKYVVYRGTEGNLGEEVCWGYVNAEDKTPPTACIAKVVGLYKEGNGEYSPISNEGIDCNDGIFSRGTALDGDGNLDWEDENVGLLICTDAEYVYDVPASWNDPNYDYYMGFPEGFDNCGNTTISWVNDEIIKYECDYREAPEYVVGRLVSTVIKRTFKVVDEKGNEYYIDQEICFFKPIIRLPDCKEHLDVCWYEDVDPNNTEEELAPATIESAPYYLNAKCEPVLLDEHVCNVTATYEDLVLPGPVDCGFKVIRTWTVLDWCWDEFTYTEGNIDLVYVPEDCGEQPTPASWNNKSFTYEQHLIIGDDEDPIVECPKIDYDWDGDYDPIVFSVGPFGCEASIDVPAPVVTNKECGYTWTVEIYTDVPVLWHGVPTGETERVEFTGAQIIEKVEEGKTVYVKAAGLPKGQHYLKYIVTDKCGNVGTNYYDGEGEVEYDGLCPFTIVDNIEPVAVCDDQLNVSVGSGSGADSGLGFARVYAQDVDEGSWDNCSPVWIQVRRFVPADIADLFVQGSDLDLVGYPNNPITLDKPGVEADGLSGFFTVWADYADFICADVGTKGSSRVRCMG